MDWRTAAIWVIGLALAMALAAVVAGQIGVFGGSLPNDLGVAGGRLKAPSKTPNCVSSQAGLHAGNPVQQSAMVAPLPLRGTVGQAMAQVRTAALGLPGAKLVSERPDYLYLQYRTRWLGFVDDAEFWADPAAGVVQVRSASRIGRKDFGVNRERIEAIRAALAAG